MIRIGRGHCAVRRTHLPDEWNGWLALPLLLWRRGLGRGGRSIFSMLRFVAKCQRVAAQTFLAGWLRMTTSSPWPSPPKEERETTPRSVSTKMRVSSNGDGRVAQAAQVAGRGILTAPRTSKDVRDVRVWATCRGALGTARPTFNCALAPARRCQPLRKPLTSASREAPPFRL